jgi:triacylglycerol esterase/lipase EstA (alpha/beta hydrolase family)
MRNWTALSTTGSNISLSGNTFQTMITDNIGTLTTMALGPLADYRLTEVSAKYAGDTTKRGGRTFATVTITAFINTLHPDQNRRETTRTGTVDIWATREDVPESMTWDIEPDDGRTAEINAVFADISAALLLLNQNR